MRRVFGDYAGPAFVLGGLDKGGVWRPEQKSVNVRIPITGLGISGLPHYPNLLATIPLLENSYFTNCQADDFGL